MKLTLSPRLLECSKYVKSGERIADIGCDHGLLSAYLLTNRIASSAIAADINEGPLSSARSNALKFHISDRISFHLSDGLCSVPHDFDCMICAGMGAETMIAILKAAPWIESSAYHLILQCQTRAHLLRQFLSETGWCIKEESIVRDGHFLYTVMDVSRESSNTLTPGQCYLSPALLRHTGPELSEYYARITAGLRQAVNGKGRDRVPELARAYDELTTDPAFYHLKENEYDNC